MTETHTLKPWAQGALLVAAMAACQSPLAETSNDEFHRNQDIVEALARVPEAQVVQYSRDGVPQFIVGELGRVDAAYETDLAASDANLRATAEPILKAFRLKSKDLVLRKVNVDEAGGRHYRYHQRFNGIDVVGGDLVVHVDITGAIRAINGTACGDIAPMLGIAEVSESAATLAIANDERWAGIAGRMVTGTRMVYVHTQAGMLHKAYEQVVEGTRGQDPVKDKVYVDVDSGAIVAVHPQIHFALNRYTYTANNGTFLPGTLQRTEAGLPVGDDDVDFWYDNNGDVFRFYNHWWNRDSYDNAGAAIKGTVHYSTNYCNAFWNGTQTVYGDGNASQNCLPLARSLDVAAHELTHAVTSFESNLTYSGESGGLNESLSDIGSAGVEAYVLGGRNGILSLDPKVFLIGDTVLPPFLRNMCDPAADGSSRDVWSSDIGSIAANYSSGPNNLVFCLLTKGGMHPRGKTTILVPAIGMEKTLRLMYKANVDILTSNSNYAAMRAAMNLAAQQLGYSQADLDAVNCAYAAINVGIAPPVCAGPGPQPLINGTPVTGIADSTVGNFKYWTLDVPANQSTVTFTISGGTGDADLYVNFGSAPSGTVYQCRPYLTGNNETCTFTPPSVGTYFVGLRAYAPYSGVTLTGTIVSGPVPDPWIVSP